MLFVKQNTSVTDPQVSSLETLLYTSKVMPTLSTAHKVLWQLPHLFV